MYKVFIKDTPVLLGRTADLGTTYEQVWSAEQLSDQRAHFEQIIGTTSIWVKGDPQTLYNQLFADHKLLIAAGGLVENGKGEWLFIHRLGRWDLPKGKLEKGESVATCALREVEEECGIQGLSMGDELPSTYHTYEHKGKQVIKRTYWFQMTVQGVPELTPQLEEDIDQAIWRSPQDIDDLLGNTYGAIADVLSVVLRGLGGS